MDLATSIITLLVGVSIFLVSLRMMSSGLRKAAGKGIRNLFSKTGNRRIPNFGIGVAATALIQSSDATSVMVIGFISAGVLTLFQGVCLILGAYVGTTATGLIVALSSFSFSKYLLCFAVVGVVMSFFQKEVVKNLGEFFTGLGFLFFGLSTMSSAFAAGSPILEGFGAASSAIEALGVGPILLFVIGILFTLITQSSSATSGIVIVLVGQSAISLSSGFYLVLGATVGSVMPTLLATIGGNADVKRTGFICAIAKSLPAIAGVAITWIFQDIFSTAFLAAFQSPQLAVAMFMFTYSLIAMSIQLCFADRYTKLAEKVVIDHETLKKQKALKYIDKRLLKSPKVAVTQVKKEVGHMLELSLENFKLAFAEIFSQNFENKNQIEETEETIDYINSEITSYLISLSPLVGEHDEKKIGGYFHMINDIERIGDHASNFNDMTVAMKDEELKFSEVAHKEFLQMYDVIIEMFGITKDIFDDKKNISELSHLHELEDQTDKLKIKLSASHFARVSEQTCKIELSSYYSTLVSELERIADHLVNVGYAFINPTGDDK